MIEFILQGKEGNQKLDAIERINNAFRPVTVLPTTEPVDAETGQLPGMIPPANERKEV